MFTVTFLNVTSKTVRLGPLNLPSSWIKGSITTAADALVVGDLDDLGRGGKQDLQHLLASGSIIVFNGDIT